MLTGYFFVKLFLKQKNFVKLIYKVNNTYVNCLYLQIFHFLYNNFMEDVECMDTIDYQILKCLKENARESATNIGAKINLSTSAVIERIKKLESAGLIEKYTTIINQNILGRELVAFIYVSLEHPKYNDNFIKIINESISVVECHYIAGDFDFILKVITKSGSTLKDVLNDIKSINGVSLTRTSVVLSTNKYEVCLLPDKENDVFTF